MRLQLALPFLISTAAHALVLVPIVWAVGSFLEQGQRSADASYTVTIVPEDPRGTEILTEDQGTLEQETKAIAISRTKPKAAAASSNLKDVPSSAQDSAPGWSEGDSRVGLVKPVYPELARRRGLEGQVTYKLLVGADGRPASIELVSSSGYTSLDQAGQAALNASQFPASTRVDTPNQRLISFAFKLDDD